MANNGSHRRFLLRRRRRRKGKGIPRWLLAIIVLGGLLLLGSASFAVGGIAAYQSCISDLIPPDDAIRQRVDAGGARIYDRDGNILFEYLNPDYGRRTPKPLDEISEHLINASVATEDADFWDNPGINVRGLGRAVWENFSPFSDTPGFLEGRGGSSITQQLVKNAYFSFQEREERAISRKWTEVCYSIELTRQNDKEQIMEWYLNLISYGSIYTGVEAASQGYFGKPASDLTLAEAALLAGIPANPSGFDPITKPEAARDRQGHVLLRMHSEGMIDDVELWSAAAQQIDINPARFEITAPHWVLEVVQPQLESRFGKESLLRDGLEVFTTLDLKWQREAERILEEQISANEDTYDGHNGAFVAIDPKTAEILVYVGSRDYFNTEILGQNDMAGAPNAPGSAFKPFTYLTAFMELGWGPGTWILDSPYTYRDPSGSTFTPCNPQGCGRFLGSLTIRDALGNSLNVPAVKAMLYAGVPKIIAQAKRMGFTNLDQQTLGPAFTVGGGDVKLIDMVYAYTVFPNLGILKGAETELDLPEGNRSLDPISILRVEDRSGNLLYPVGEGGPIQEEPPNVAVLEERVAPAAETYLVTDILVDPDAECIIFGCGRLSIPDGRPLAVKTGTSAPYENTRQTGDTWTIAYTPQIVAGTWFGNADNSPIRSATSTRVSWPIVEEFMTAYHQDLPAEPFTRPEDVVEGSVCILSGFTPAPDCPLATPKDLFAKDVLPEELPQGEDLDDPWWERARIDIRSGLLASAITPARFARDGFFLQLPDNLTEFERSQAGQWALLMNAIVGEVPTRETTLDDLPILIDSPENLSAVSQGLITITGRATSSAFQSYRLDWRFGLTGSSWTVIGQTQTTPVASGTLGVWDANGLTPGFYTIRLVLVDRQRGTMITETVIVLVEAEPEPPPPTPSVQSQGPPGQGHGPPQNN